jgi:16S rRNA (uracil1498-N3)-methyltransferase
MRNAGHFLFYAERLETDVVVLDGREARHAVAALRGREGDIILVTDGRGAICRCEVVSAAGQRCELRVVERTRQPLPHPALHLLVGLPEREAFERLIEEVVPLGVWAITPLECGYCQRKWWAGGWDKQRERLRRKMIAGMKQAQSAWLPELRAPRPLLEGLEATESIRLVADEDGCRPAGVADEVVATGSVACLVGPPGGFGPEERTAIGRHGYRPVWLSANRLRTELAAVVMAASVMQMGGGPF